MRLVAILLVVGCSGGSTSAPRPQSEPVANKPGTTTTTATPTTHAFRPDQVCNRFVALKEQHCGKFEGFDIGDSCAKELATGLEDPATRPTMQLVGECTIELETCADVVACLGALDAQTALRGCHEKNPQLLGQAVGLPRDAWKTATRRNARKYSDIASSKAQPVEVCGIPTENEWLASLSCDDGSMPITDGRSAEMARVGNVGDGGRCNAIIDRYKVQCPEASYEIYLDGYVCPLPQ